MVRHHCYLRCWRSGPARQARSSRVYPAPGLPRLVGRELRITRVSRCVARGHKARASFMSAGCCWRRSLAADGGSGTSRGHVPELRSPYKRPQRCCAAWRVTPSRAAISAHEYPMFRSPVTAQVIASSSSAASPVMSVRASASPAATRRAWARITRRANAAYSSFSTGRRRRFGVKLLLTVDRLAGPPAVETGGRWRPRAVVPAWPRSCSCALLLPPRPGEGGTAWGLHPIGAGVVEPGVEVKLRLLDALDWQRSPRERVVLLWRGHAKGSCG